MSVRPSAASSSPAVASPSVASPAPAAAAPSLDDRLRMLLNAARPAAPLAPAVPQPAPAQARAPAQRASAASVPPALLVSVRDSASQLQQSSAGPIQPRDRENRQNLANQARSLSYQLQAVAADVRPGESVQFLPAERAPAADARASLLVSVRDSASRLQQSLRANPVQMSRENRQNLANQARSLSYQLQAVAAGMRPGDSVQFLPAQPVVNQPLQAVAAPSRPALQPAQVAAPVAQEPAPSRDDDEPNLAVLFGEVPAPVEAPTPAPARDIALESEASVQRQRRNVSRDINSLSDSGIVGRMSAQLSQRAPAQPAPQAPVDSLRLLADLQRSARPAAPAPQQAARAPQAQAPGRASLDRALSQANARPQLSGRERLDRSLSSVSQGRQARANAYVNSIHGQNLDQVRAFFSQAPNDFARAVDEADAEWRHNQVLGEVNALPRGLVARMRGQVSQRHAPAAAPAPQPAARPVVSAPQAQASARPSAAAPARSQGGIFGSLLNRSSPSSAPVSGSPAAPSAPARPSVSAQPQAAVVSQASIPVRAVSAQPQASAPSSAPAQSSPAPAAAPVAAASSRETVHRFMDNTPLYDRTAGRVAGIRRRNMAFISAQGSRSQTFDDITLNGRRIEFAQGLGDILVFSRAANTQDVVVEDEGRAGWYRITEHETTGTINTWLVNTGSLQQAPGLVVGQLSVGGGEEIYIAERQAAVAASQPAQASQSSQGQRS